MVQVASSSKSNPPQAKSTHTAFKVGPPSKKPAAVSLAKAKNMKQKTIDLKKHVHSGVFFFFFERLHI
jgi:hypothetical protein